MREHQAGRRLARGAGWRGGAPVGEAEVGRAPVGYNGNSAGWHDENNAGWQENSAGWQKNDAGWQDREKSFCSEERTRRAPTACPNGMFLSGLSPTQFHRGVYALLTSVPQWRAPTA